MVTPKKFSGDRLPQQIYEKVLAAKEAPTFSDFADPLNVEALERDRRELERLKGLMNDQNSAYEKGQKKWAEVFECIVCAQIELDDWLGGDAMTAFTSEYDDVIHGVDGVIELGNEEGRHDEDVRFGFDCTFSQQSLEKKLSRMRDRLNAGRLYDVKYFISPHSDKKIPLRDIPLVIIFTDKEMVSELTSEWSFDKKKLAKNPFKFVVLEQMLFQLLAMRAYLDAPHSHTPRDKKRGLIYQIDTVIHTVATNAQKVLLTSFDRRAEEYMKGHPHVREVQERIASVLHLDPSSQILPEGYAYALQWALDRDAPILPQEEVVPDLSETPTEQEASIQEIRLLGFVNRIRADFGENIPYSRVFRYAKEAETPPGKRSGLYKKPVDVSAFQRRHIGWLNISTELVYIEPSVAEAVYARFKKLYETPFAPEGWKTNRQVFEVLDSKQIAIKVETVKKLARLLSEGPEEIKLFQAPNNRPYLFYSPDLIARIYEYCVDHKEKRLECEVVAYEPGWKSIREIAAKYRGEVSDAAVRAIADQHPDKMKFMRREGEQPFRRCSPELEVLIEGRIHEKKDIPTPGLGEMTRPQLVDFFGGNRKTVYRLLDAATKAHPEWKVERRPKMGKPETYYTQEAREALATEIVYIQSLSEPKIGEMTNQAAARYLTIWLRTQFVDRGVAITPIADLTLQKAVRRILPDEHLRKQQIHDRRTGDGNYYPHLSSQLIEQLKKEFLSIYETPVPGPGEVTRFDMAQRIQTRFGIGKSSADNLITKYVKGDERYTVERRREGDTAIITCYLADEVMKLLEKVRS